MAEITKNTDEQRFEIRVEGVLAGVVDYSVGHRGVVALDNAVVQPEFRGHGVAGELVRGALDDIRSQGYLVKPVCSYVQWWVQRHPEYSDVVATGPSGAARTAADAGVASPAVVAAPSGGAAIAAPSGGAADAVRPGAMEDATGVHPRTDPRV